MASRKLGWLIAIIGMASLTVAAQTAKDGIATINGGRKTILLKPESAPKVPAAPLPAGVVTIYSNLGTGTQVYNGFSGAGILGHDAGQPLPQWVAMPFTPSADHVVQQIRLGLGYNSGTNAVTVTLNEDEGGIPGKVIHSWNVTGLPAFGTCCTLTDVRAKGGIQVKKGVQYWVAVGNTQGIEDTWAVWDDNFAGTQGTWANNTGSGWNASFQVEESFAVYGH